MLSITCERILRALEWLLFLALCGVSIIFIKEIILKFYSEDSSFKISEEYSIEHPTIAICNLFKKDEENGTSTDYRLGIDYEVIDSSVNDTIILGELKTVMNRNCLKNIRKSDSMEAFMQGGYRTIQITFNKSIPEENLPKELKVYVTSEKNTYGILTNQWMDGEMFEFEVNQNFHKVIDLKQEKYIYLQKARSKCSHESFYECLVKRIVNTNFTNCPKKCNPMTFTLPSSEEYDKIPLCEGKEQLCANNLTVHVFRNTTTQICPKLCNIVQYSGKLIMVYNHKQGPYNYSFRYRFAPPHTEKIFEEYLIYDIVSMVGSVGGNLGMWIGFSFTGIISNLMKIIRNHRSEIMRPTGAVAANGDPPRV